MSSATCPNCGAALIVGAKFCRQCGRLADTSNARSVTEATTRTLHTPVDFAAQPTNILSSQPTGPAYLAPGGMQQPPAQTPGYMEQKGRQLNVWLIVSMVALILLIGSLFVFGIVKLNNSRTTTQPPSVTQPPTTTVPDIPPPPPPPPPGTTGSNSISRAFIYPGAETIMDMSRADGGNFLQLRTNDSYQKVLDWYVARLKPDSIIKSPPGQSAVLKSDKLIVIINSSGEGTVIMLKQGDEGDMDFDM